MKSNSVQVLMLIIMLSCNLLISKIAVAGDNGTCPTSPTLPIVQTLPSVAVLSTLPVGSVIPGTDKTFNFTGSCPASQARNVSSGDPIITCYYGSGAAVAGMSGVYSTGVTGVGIAVENSSGQRITSASGWSCNSSATRIGTLGSDANKSFTVSIKLSLIKTATTILPGTISQAQTQWGLGVFHNGAPSGVSLSNATNPTIAYAGNVVLKSVACTLQSSLNYPMGNVPINTFTGVGSAVASQTLNLPVSCNSPVSVSMNMTSGSYENQKLGVISTTKSAGYAAGVGVQLLYNNTPINLGSNLSVGSIITANSTLNIPITAKYYQTAATISAGTANATASINMIYN